MLNVEDETEDMSLSSSTGESVSSCRRAIVVSIYLIYEMFDALDVN